MIPHHYLPVLEALGPCKTYTKDGRQGWWVKCPAHEDNRPSLSLTINEDGKLVWYCKAGCSQRSVMEGIMKTANVKSTAFFPPKDKGRPFKIDAVYVYRYEDGSEAYRVCKQNSPKDFRQQRRVNGKLTWSNGGAKILYNLPALVAEPTRTVWLTEGEKDAESLGQLNLLATTNSGGALNWPPEDVKVHLANRKVIIVADNDEAGQKRIRVIGESLRGICPDLRVLHYTGKDITEWIEGRILANTKAIEIRGYLVGAASNAPKYSTWKAQRFLEENADIVDDVMTLMQKEKAA